MRESAGRLLPPYGDVSRFKSVYVVTYGRSGSTMLLGYLNLLPGFDIRGENYQFSLPMWKMFSRIQETAQLKYRNRHLPESAWYGTQKFNVETLRRDIYRLMMNQFYPTQRIPKTMGFKEIRWWQIKPATDVVSQVEWLTSIRPPSAVIFLTRDLEAVFNSGFWVKTPEAKRVPLQNRLREFEEIMKTYVADNPDSAIHLTHEGFLKDENVRKQLHDFLGVKYSPHYMERALSVNYSPGPKRHVAAKAAAESESAELLEEALEDSES